LLQDSLPEFLASTISNPPLFLSDRIYPNDSILKHLSEARLHHKNLYFDQHEFREVMSHPISSGTGDTVYMTAFSPVRAEAFVRTGSYQVLIFLQSNYYGWKAKIDKTPSNILTSNTNFQSVLVPPGEHEVEFYYRPFGIIVAFYISLFSLFLFGIYLLFSLFVNKQKTL
jgi:hypothetical protein